MPMGLVSEESGVLKLVHPGGFVEIYKRSITAAEVMKRNPRHCVTRPDVFQYPWIVVNPKSVLKPGRVFFVVPHHTLYRLLQSKGSRNNPSTVKEDSDPRQKVTSPIDLWKDHEATYRGHDQLHRKKDSTECSFELTHFHQLVKKGNPVASENKVNSKCEYWPEDFPGSNFLVGSNEQYRNKFYRTKSLIQSDVNSKTKQDSDESPRKKYLVEHWSKELAGQRAQVPLFLEAKPLFSFQYASSDEEVQALPPRYDGRPDLNSSQQITKLKSCLKKHSDVPKPSRSRVRFSGLDEDDRKLGMQVHKVSTE